MMRALLCLTMLLCASCAAPPQPIGPAPADVPLAWVRFDARGIGSSGASGMADAEAGRALTIYDPVRIASVSKLIVALGVMRLVEQGKLDLDRDVSDWLGWRLRNPAFPDRPITLRLLLSHLSSLKDDADYVIPLGRTVQETVAKLAAFDAEHPPGTFFRYSNLNFPVIASVMEKASGERFDRLIDGLVLRPLALDACFNWSGCSDGAIARAAVLYLPEGKVRDDLKGRPPECPVVPREDGGCDLSGYILGSNGALFSPQGGLRISARDLAKVGQLLLRRGWLGSEQFLRPESIEALLQPHWRHDGSNGAIEEGFYCGYGLGVQILPTDAPGCRDDLLGDGTELLGHAGDAYGVRSGLWIDRRRGEGIAYFATSNGPDPQRGLSSYRAIEERLVARLRR